MRASTAIARIALIRASRISSRSLLHLHSVIRRLAVRRGCLYGLVPPRSAPRHRRDFGPAGQDGILDRLGHDCRSPPLRWRRAFVEGGVHQGRPPPDSVPTPIRRLGAVLEQARLSSAARTGSGRVRGGRRWTFLAPAAGSLRATGRGCPWPRPPLDPEKVVHQILGPLVGQTMGVLLVRLLRFGLGRSRLRHQPGQSLRLHVAYGVQRAHVGAPQWALLRLNAAAKGVEGVFLVMCCRHVAISSASGCGARSSALAAAPAVMPIAAAAPPPSARARRERLGLGFMVWACSAMTCLPPSGCG